jgi:RNA polymerase sigma factor (sigma-70 family)
VTILRRETRQRRDARHDEALGDAAEARPSPLKTPSAEAANREEAEAIKAAVGRLSSRDQHLIWLKCEKGLSWKQIAEEAEMSPAAAEQAYWRAIRKLREEALR